MIQFQPPFFESQDPKLKVWVSGMITALQEAFQKIEPQLPAGTVVLWPTGVDIPTFYLECDGAEYSRSVSTSLYKLLGESSPGMFQVPTITGPTGSTAVIRV